MPVILYTIAADGTLQWYEHFQNRGGPASWLGPSPMNRHWTHYREVFAGDFGAVYAIDSDGTLLWHRHLEQAKGGPAWLGPQPVGRGWHIYISAFPGDGGVLYGLKKDGTLLWFKHLGEKDGSAAWLGPRAVSPPRWQRFKTVFAGSEGAVYGVKKDGTLVWHRHLGWRDGSVSWAGPVAVGSGWHLFRQIVAARDGILYAIQKDGTLLWYRHHGFLDGNPSWCGPEVVGADWNFAKVFCSGPLLSGYCWPQSAPPGQKLSFMVSSPADFEVQFVRYQRVDGQNEALAVGQSQTCRGEVQVVPPQPWAQGCGWTETFAFQVPADWPSGIYAAQCGRGGFCEVAIPFIVKGRPKARGDFAVLANTNTWNAYNDWGGMSKYTAIQAERLSFHRPNPGADPRDTGLLNHLTRAELWVLDWLAAAGCKFDVYTDHDFHAGIAGLHKYKGLILSTHPEYWTVEMVEQLHTYLAAGGRVLYLGGNGVFERTVFSPCGTFLTMFPQGRPRPRSYYRNLTPPRPEREMLGVAFRNDGYHTWAAYQVLSASHRMLQGTALKNGDLIGSAGLNGGGASGWEMDTSLPGNALPGVIVTAEGADDRGTAPRNLEILARGTNPGDGAGVAPYGADMTYYKTPHGGFVFSAGSISFGGSLVVDGSLQQIVANVLNECLGRQNQLRVPISAPLRNDRRFPREEGFSPQNR